MRLASRGKTLQYLKQLQEWQWLDTRQAQALQQQRLGALLRHAAEKVPYYKTLLRECHVIDEHGKVRFENFTRIPLLDRATLKKQYHSLISEDVSQRRWYENSSGGSTGEPVKFIQDRDHYDWESALKIFFDGWTGFKIGYPKVVLWGSERDLFYGKEPFNVRAGRFIRNDTFLNAFRMTPVAMASYVECINQVQPAQILGYAHALYELARFAEKYDHKLYSPKAIIATAGTLFPEMREAIERAYGAPVFNRYGSREVGDIACECEAHKGLHVALPTHYVEVLRNDGSPAHPGEDGEIVVTCLTNFAMPLIRYRIGDMGSWAEGDCTCGRAWPRLREVSGRVMDAIICANGDSVTPTYFIRLMRLGNLTDQIDKFQVIQESVKHITISIVAKHKSEQLGKSLVDVKEKIKLVMGDDCQVEFNFVDDIPPSPSGKYRYVISKVQSS